MPSDFLQAVQVGANMRSMAWQQQDRMMQLQAQRSMQAVQERQLAAQAQSLLETAALHHQELLQKEDDERERQAFKAAVGDEYMKNLNATMDPETGEVDHNTAALMTGTVLQKLSPKLANDFMASHAKAMAPQVRLLTNERTVQGRENVAQTNAAARLQAAQSRVGRSPMLATIEGRRDLKQQILDAEDAQDFDKADSLRDDLRALDAMNPGLRASEKLPEADRLAIAGHYRMMAQDNAAYTKSMEEDPEKGQALRSKLSWRIGQHKKEIDAILAKSSAAAGPSPAPAEAPATAPSASSGPAPKRLRLVPGQGFVPVQ